MVLIGLLLSIDTAMAQTSVTYEQTGNEKPARRVKNGIIIVDTGAVVRALEPYNGCSDGGRAYADIVAKYQKAFPKTQVYCMVIPTAVAYYCPDSMKQFTKAERPVIENLLSKLPSEVKAVDVFETLQSHVNEPIYSRTDHHWSPLGAYYAAQHFAQVAGVPFMDLENYESRVIHHFVGSMYTFSRDMAVKNAPEDFVYYVPKGIDYSATRTIYQLTRDRRSVLRAGDPEPHSFFVNYKDGSGSAYCTFMGGDTNTTSISTSTKNGRRLLILKDSYGNALPSFLFASFEEIHVVDCRYFTQNIAKFVESHAITDILFANNLVHASMARTCQTYERYITQ